MPTLCVTLTTKMLISIRKLFHSGSDFELSKALSWKKLKDGWDPIKEESVLTERRNIYVDMELPMRKNIPIG